jgi:hypothetical protein
MKEFIVKVNAEYDKLLADFTKRKPSLKEIYEAFVKNFHERGCLIGTKPIPTFIKPYFMSYETIEKARKVSAAIISALEKVSDVYFESPESRKMFQEDPNDIILYEMPTHLPKKLWITRLDSFMTEEWLQFIEFNCDSPGGPMYSDVQNELLMETPILTEFEKNYDLACDMFMPDVLKTLLSAYKAHGGRDKPTIAISAGQGTSTKPEFDMIIAWFIEQGFTALFSHPEEFEYKKGSLYHHDTKIHIIYRRGWIKDWSDHLGEIKPLLNAYKDGAVCVVNPPTSKIAGNKALLELLTEGKMDHKFTKFECQVIKDHVPWTRVVSDRKTEYKGKTVDMIDCIIKNKKNLVMKPSNLFGGKDVFIGSDVTDEQWADVLKKAKERIYVVQEKVQIPEELMPEFKPDLVMKPKKINMNFFTYDGIMAGGFARTSESSIINVSVGGGLIPIIIVKDKK